MRTLPHVLSYAAEEATTEISSDTPLVDASGGVVNPWAYFGWCKRWPAGYPMTTILAQGLDPCVLDTPQRQQYSNRTQQSYIHHVLADDPSYADAVGQLMGTWAHAADAAPPSKQMVVTAGAMSPYGLSSTAYHRSVPCDTVLERDTGYLLAVVQVEGLLAAAACRDGFG
jgi:hypothetical protein